jgi:hypothetical protein
MYSTVPGIDPPPPVEPADPVVEAEALPPEPCAAEALDAPEPEEAAPLPPAPVAEEAPSSTSGS